MQDEPRPRVITCHNHSMNKCLEGLKCAREHLGLEGIGICLSDDCPECFGDFTFSEKFDSFFEGGKDKGQGPKVPDDYLIRYRDRIT